MAAPGLARPRDDTRKGGSPQLFSGKRLLPVFSVSRQWSRPCSSRSVSRATRRGSGEARRLVLASSSPAPHSSLVLHSDLAECSSHGDSFQVLDASPLSRPLSSSSSTSEEHQVRCTRLTPEARDCRQKLETRSVTLDEPVLEAVLRNLSLRQRLQYRTVREGWKGWKEEVQVSRSVQTALSRLPLKVSFLMVRSVDGVCFDIVCDQPDFLVHYLLAGLSPTVVADGVRCKVDEVLFYLDTIRKSFLEGSSSSSVSRLNGAEHLWLETSGHNGVLARRIFEFLHRDEGCARKRKRAFSVSQFTVVGTCSSPDFDAVCSEEGRMTVSDHGTHFHLAIFPLASPSSTYSALVDSPVGVSLGDRRLLSSTPLCAV